MKLILPSPYFRGIGILACMLLIFSSLKSQVPSACPIGAAMEPKSNSELKSTSSGREINFLPYTGWSGKQNVKFSDDQKAMITLGSIDRSRVFVGDNFKFQIPAGATIKGIMLMVEGLSDNYKNIDEVLISLTDAYGEVKGQNKSNQAKLQKAWNKSTSGEDHTWMYGSSSDIWGAAWSSDEINDSDFGFNIQIRNIDATPIKVAIDQITILVYYTPAYSFCDDNCLTFHIDKFENYGSYAWEEVKGFTLVSKSYNQQTIDLKVGNASFGLHQICVNVYDKQGRFAERCCRQFLYPDCSASEIRGQVWLDQNDNNLFESYEGILPNTPIILFTNSNIPIDTVLSNDAGKYVFTKIIPGSYYLKVPALSNKSFVLKNNINPDRNSDITGSFGPGTTDVIHVEIGKIYENIDFGYKPLVTLGDYVWEDKNYNGIQDANEKGIPEVQVKLFTSDHKLKDSTTTDSLGKYTFSNIAANTYYLIFSAPADFRPTWKNNSVLLNSKIDASGKTEMYTFKNSEIKLDIDAGFFITGSIGDLAWEDKNGDGLLNTGEVPVGGVKISLIGTSGNGLPIEKSTTTDSMGRYLFTYLQPGQYRLVVMKPDGFEFTTPDAGDDDLDSDVINGFVNGIEIMSGSSFHNIDIGLYRFASLGDMVWEDLNANGIMEEGEPGIPNVKVVLSEVLRDKIVLIDSTTTNDLGKYYFENLKPGNYKVDFTLPSNFNPTLKDIGNDDSIDSDVSGNSIAPISLMSGQINNSYDAGYYKYGSIGDFVWEDFNANGIQDLSESGIVEVVLTLTGKDGFGNEILRRDTTDNNGKYLFENLIPGQYSLQISDVSPMFVPTKVDQGFDDLLDSDSDLGFISGIILQSGKLDVSNDFGFVRELSIGDFVWNDLNANGIQEVGEPGLPNVTLKLQGIRFDGIAVDKTATTDNNGLYTFDKLLPGKYTISVDILPGYSATKTLIGNDPSIDSNLPLDSNNFSFELANSAAISNFDFGLVKLGELLGYVYEDENCDNIQQPNELGIAGISIQLSGIDFLGTEVQKTVVTDSLGYYLFNELKPGIYNVMVIQPSGFESTITLNFEITIDQNKLLVIRNIPLFRRASVGDFVWFDTNNNGLQDVEEAGILGVVVTISSSTLLTPKETVTDSLGNYTFTDLKPGRYSLQFAQVADNTYTTPKVGSNDAIDSDVDSTGLVTGVVLTSGQSKTDIDAGYISTATASIGDFVWEDFNGNGLQESSEPGIAGVTVTLTGLTTSGKTINVSTTTNIDGIYSFDNLAQGKYKVAFMLPTSYLFTNQGSAAGNANDSDPDVITGQTAEFDVSQGQVLNTIDAGMYRYGSIGDFVWFDTNNNGLQDVGESGIPGVIVTISGSTLLTPKETVTDSLGKYIFIDLKPGSYSLQFAQIADNTSTTPKVGSNDAIDSDIDSTGLVTGMVVSSGQTMTDIDAGYISTATATIGDFVWEDLNGNGLQESGEPGIAGVTVTLTGLTTSGKTINASTTTNTDGKYSFTSLAQGKYKVTFGLPITYYFTNQGVGGDRAIDSDVNVMTGETAEFDVSIGQIINTIDAGMYRYGSIGDFVWYDTNNNGLQDMSESGIPGVMVTISGSTLLTPKETVTDSLGKYIFTDLKPGSYSLQFAQVADNTSTTPKVGSNDTIDSDVDSTGLVTGVVVSSGQTMTDIDAGYISTATATIGDFVWDDLNGNGLQESGEPGIAGVTVTLTGLTTSGKTINVSTTTNAEGKYSFTSLAKGKYKVTFGLPTTYFFTNQGVGGDRANDSDVNVMTGETAEFDVSIGQIINTIDAGMFRFGSIGDFVWYDTNNNGLQDVGEAGIPGVIVSISGSTLLTPKETVTDSLGKYLFTDLKPGSYSLQFAQVADNTFTTPKVGTNDAIDSDVDSTGLVTGVVLSSGETITNIDAGYISTSTASIGDFVWEDLNGNGLQDIGEPGIAGVTVNIKGESGSVANVQQTTVSDAAGRYSFNGLKAGMYSITFIKSIDFQFTQNISSQNSINSDADPITGKTSLITLVSGQNHIDIDAGFYKFGSIGDFVWHDSNGNGLQDSTELGISGIEMNLLSEDGSFISSIITDSIGYYKFTNLAPRAYKVEATIPNIYTITVTNNSNLNLNSDFIVQNGKITTNPIVILSNTNKTDIDLGLKELKSSLSGLAWCDTNGDGLRNVGEPFIDSLIIKLLTTDGALVSRDTTNANGEYSFDNVSVGKYFIQFDTIIGKYFSQKNQGLDPNVDSDIIPTVGRTDTLIVTSGISMEHLDAGYIPYSAMGDFVWIDSNKNGLQEQNENGINGIWIKLLNNSGVVLDSVLSSTKNGKSGYYDFKNLTFGSYIIQFPLPQNFEYTIKVASDSILNSDIIDINTGKTELIYVAPGQIRTDIDAGYILITTSNGSISGLAWQDIDNNKLRELNEPLLAGISITLFSISGNIISTTISATDGTYSFSDIPFGDYYISAAAIENKPFVLYLGTPSNMDSDISNEFGIGTTRLINVLPGANITNIDIGFYATMSIGDFVWDDLNNNGLQESGEPGLAGILVSLIDESGTVRKTVISDSTGKYLIDSVATGRYKLSFGSRPGYVHAINNPADVIRNSKADVSTGVTPLLDFLVAQAYTDVDAGYVRTGSIGDRVWLDLNGNGFFQMGEPGIANVKIYLNSSTGLLVDSTLSVTEPNGEFAGYYIFTNVRPGTYYVKFNIPPNYLISPAGIGGDDDDSNITEENGPLTTGNFVVGPGQFVFNIDAAAYLPATIGDRVWDDINKNGVQDPNEPGIGGIGVKIFTQNGILVDTTTTNSQGIYSFSGLRQRLYYLQFTIRDGFEFTLINASGSSSTDSDVDPTGTTPLISLAHGSILLDIDAGMHRSNNRLVMGTIWNDYNKDGIRTDDEKLQNGIRVHLKDMLLGSVKTYTTNHAGMYCLSTPTQGEHRVVVEAPDDHVFTAKKMGVSREFDSDVNEDGESENLMLDEKYKMDYIDAGFYFKVISSINGLVWKDVNKNGYRDDKDLPIPNIVIFLFNQDKIFVKSTKSNDRGEYSLKHLTPGKYYCSLPQFPDLDFVMFTGANQEKDSEFTNQYGIGTTRLVTIDPGIPLLNFDFGYKELTNFNSDENNRQVIGVYPNPAVTELRVKAPPSEEPYEFVVVNNQGFAIKKGFLTNNENALDVGHLPPGRYTLHVSTSNGVIIKSFIKIDN